MSKEQALEDQLEREKQKNEKLEQEVQGHKTREQILEEEVIVLKRRMRQKTSNSSENGITHLKIGDKAIMTTLHQNEDSTSKAITDLHFNQMSPVGSNSAPVTGNTNSTSDSFVVLGKTSGPHQLTGSGTSVVVSNLHQEHQKILQASVKLPMESHLQSDSKLIIHSHEKQENALNFESLNEKQNVLNMSQTTVEKISPFVHIDDSWPLNSDVWNGTGARPKSSYMPISTQETLVTITNPTIRDKSLMNESVVQTRKMVSIPKDEGTYRINHALPYQNREQNISITGISSLFSPNAEPTSDTNTRQINAYEILHIEPTQLNDLNSGTQKSSDGSQFSPLQMINKVDVDKKSVSSDFRKKDCIFSPSLSTSSSSSFKSPVAQIVLGFQPQMSTDEDIDLARQLHTLVQELKPKFLTQEDVDRINKCAEEASKMETRLKEYEFQIQKHQVYNSSMQSIGAEVQRLKNENEKLTRLLHVPVQQNDVQQSGLESGWITVTENDTQPNQIEEETLKEKLKEVTSVNTQLFFANNQWEDSWKLREQQHAEHCEELYHKLDQSNKEKLQLKQESESAIVELKEEINTLKLKQHELEQQDTVRESHYVNEQKLNRKFKEGMGSFRLKVKKEMEHKVKELTNKIKEIETENLIMKEQLTVTMDDFHKERSERTAIEEQLKKVKAEKKEIKGSLDTKLKSANSLVQRRDEEICKRGAVVMDLHKQIDDLKAKLRTAERRAVLQQPSSETPMSQMPSTVIGQSDLLYPSASPAYSPTQLRMLHQQNEFAKNYAGIQDTQYAEGHEEGSNFIQAASAEHSPESWECRFCTYINYPYLKICLICNSARSSDASLPYSMLTDTLLSRGKQQIDIDT